MSEQTVYLIRRVHNKKIFYLKNYDAIKNKAEWTTKFMVAHHFIDEGIARTLIDRFLPTRNCDIYEHQAMWVI